MPATTETANFGEVTVPLASFIQPMYRHYFSGRPERPNYRVRRYDFPGNPVVMPLVRAFLSTCAATRSSDYRYLFTLLGSELANNAVRHTRSGRLGGTFSLLVDRHRDGLHLVCRDEGPVLRDVECAPVPGPRGVDLGAESGRGLAMVDAFATEWGTEGFGRMRRVWCYLAFDFEDSEWVDLLAT